MEYTLLILEEGFKGNDKYRTSPLLLDEVDTIELFEDDEGVFFNVDEQLRQDLMNFEIKNLNKAFLNYLAHLENNKDEAKIKNELLNIIDLHTMKCLVYINGKILTFEEWFWKHRSEGKVYVLQAYKAKEKFLIIYKEIIDGIENYEVYESSKEGYDDELVLQTNNLANELNYELEHYKGWKVIFKDRTKNKC